MVGHARLTPISGGAGVKIPGELFTLYFYYIEPTLTGGTGVTKKVKAVTVEAFENRVGNQVRTCCNVAKGFLTLHAG